MTYQKAGIDDVDSVVDEEWGGMWFLRDALGCETVGLTILELEPGGKSKEHDHADSDHEEVYLVAEGEVEVDCDGETVTLRENEALRLSPDQRRQIHNRSDERVKLVLAGAP
ncbi:cupin domain-containing protein [Halomarina litorea]|uniref:cupin domain-containing protein n=1 Tax=Halomarina litorea TaxID=2961595 RepID=UPI0020C307DF|nr:cupin domain-containing protein [Halomarina sp. BCD28]